MTSPTTLIAGLSIRAKLALLGSALLLGQIWTGVVQYRTIHRYKIGGTAYAGLKAHLDSVDALGQVLADAHRLDASLRSVGERPGPEEVRRAREQVVALGDGVAARLQRVRKLQAGAGADDPVRDAAAAWDAAYAPILARFSTEVAVDGRELAAFLGGPQRERYARMVGEVEAALGQIRGRVTRVEQEAKLGVQRAVARRLAVGGGAGVLVVVLAILLTRSILRPLSSLVRVSERVSQGDLSVELPPSAGGELGRVTEGVGQMVRALRAMVGELAGSAAEVGDAAEQMRGVAVEQMAGAQRAAEALYQTQATVEEIRQMSRVAFERAGRLRRAAEAASGVGRSGAASLAASRGGIESIKAGIDEIGERIGSLSARAQSLGRVARTIKDITDQTNMLALNAAMEAMRAGEHGRAFAVVAREMRSLTDRAAQSAEDIARELDGTGEALRQAVGATDRGRAGMNVGLNEIEASARTLQQLTEMVSQSSGVVGEIATAVGQQDEGIGQVSGALTELTATMAQSEDRVARIQESIALLERAATRVREAAGTFRV